ncbi:MAG: hypothetical protein GX070_05670 [Alcaligenaceae bacterium]|nr:hypothetical protein [Alcaligenaceae bacterium]
MRSLYKHPDGHKMTHDHETKMLTVSDDEGNKVSIPVGNAGLLQIGKAFISAFRKGRLIEKGLA